VTERSGRPRARTMVRLDLDNAYAELGVSPLATTKEIKETIARKRGDALGRRRQRGDAAFGEEEVEMTRLQQLEALVGNEKARQIYDRDNPQNLLLTVQPPPGVRWNDPRWRGGLVTAWLIEELGPQASLPSPASHGWWAPAGLEPAAAECIRKTQGGRKTKEKPNG
jgi:hypothetical protein